MQDLAACVDETIALAGALETAQEAEVSQARAVQARDMFLLGMQHEIRTQLNGILGFSEVLKDLAPEPEAKRLGDDIGRCGERLCALLTPLVEERDRSVRQPPARPFHTRDLRELFGEIDVVVRSQGQPGRLQVHLQGAPDARLPVRVAERVRLMVYDMLHEAIAWLDDGCVIVRAAVEDEREFRLAVKVTGEGDEPDFRRAERLVAGVGGRFRRIDARRFAATLPMCSTHSSLGRTRSAA